MDQIFYILETIGIMSFAISGMLLAERKNYDPVGWYVVACVTAFGGGTVRDVILDVQPVYWISHWEYPAVILLLTGLFYTISRFRIKRIYLVTTDAFGLALFTFTGAQTAFQNQYPAIIVLIIAVMTACFGGLIRDVMCNEEPMLFKKSNLYAVVSFSGASLYVGMTLLNVWEPITIGATICFIFVFRLMSYRYNWQFG